MTYVVVLILVVLFALGLAMVIRRRSAGDGVDSFRRQIDALSPEARRPTVDQVKSVEREHDTRRQARSDDAGETSDVDDEDS